MDSYEGRLVMDSYCDHGISRTKSCSDCRASKAEADRDAARGMLVLTEASLLRVEQERVIVCGERDAARSEVERLKEEWRCVCSRLSDQVAISQRAHTRIAELEPEIERLKHIEALSDRLSVAYGRRNGCCWWSGVSREAVWSALDSALAGKKGGG